MEKTKQYTKVEMIDLLITENRNELTKGEIMESVYARLAFSNPQSAQMRAVNQG